ncbi:MAG: hypothetical protein K0A90_08660 [Methanosarcinaceae archaeon]|nr:hypothetical protein [Methanosarcinaceae archaeon]
MNTTNMDFLNIKLASIRRDEQDVGTLISCESRSSCPFIRAIPVHI